ncbi:Cutinase [Cytospora mali]|uniref:Cutinase n=1 Tax=Cytospora mali TaxID=578113 RepID=A0A194UPI2_CYTMA|nr:Cutinase [Valsa mali var. pyri (nom. inval.)]
MQYQQLLIAYLSATAAALPSGLKDRQSSGISGLGGLSGGTGTGTDSIPSSIPTGLLGGLGSGSGSLGSGTGTGTDSIPSSIPTGLLGGLGSGSLGSSSSSSSSGLGSLTSSFVSGGSSTENGLSDACQKVTLIFARGTSELGNMGSIVGPGLSTDLKSALNNNVAVQGVDYAADAAGIAEEIGSAGPGTKAMIKDVQTALSKCPDTQIVLSGYSQGAMLVHNTMSSLTSTQAASVKVALTFGDPFVGESIKNLPSGSFKSFCATDDSVCLTGASSSPSSGGTTSASTSGHLGYGADTETAATFVKGKVSV